MSPAIMRCLVPVLAFSLAFAASCKPKETKPEGGDAVLAKVGDVTITVRDFEETINAYSPYLRQKYSSPEMKKKKLDEMIEFELLALEARNLGYMDDPIIQEALKQQLVRELQEQILSGIKLEDITEEETRKYYDDNAGKYHKPPQIRVAHILLGDKVKAQALLDELLQAETDAVKWRDAVMKYTEDPENKDHGGDLGYFSKPEQKTEGEPDLPEAIVKASWEIKDIGKLYPQIVEVEGKFHILKLTSTRPAIERTFDQVKRQIQSILWKEKREKAQQDFIDQLEKNAKVEVDYSLLSEIKIPDAASTDPALAPPAEAGPPAAPPVEGKVPVITPPGGTIPVVKAKPQ